MEALYRAYKAWCKENKVNPVTANKFGRAMEGMQFERGREGAEQTKSYRGIVLKKNNNPLVPIVPISPILPVCKGKEEESISESVLSELSVLEETVSDFTWKDWINAQPGGLAEVDAFLAQFPTIDLAALRAKGEVYEPRPGFVRCIL